MGTEQWFFARDGKAIGPFELRTMHRLIEEETLLPGHFVWNSEIKKWARIETISVMQPVFMKKAASLDVIEYSDAPPSLTMAVMTAEEEIPGRPNYAGFLLRAVASVLDLGIVELTWIAYSSIQFLAGTIVVRRMIS